MSALPDAVGLWERAAGDLRACRAAQRLAWGALDDAVLGRYAAGEATESERRQVESAVREHPQLRELLELVTDSLPAGRPRPASEPIIALPAAAAHAADPEEELHPGSAWVRWAAAASATFAAGLGAMFWMDAAREDAARGARAARAGPPTVTQLALADAWGKPETGPQAQIVLPYEQREWDPLPASWSRFATDPGGTSTSLTASELPTPELPSEAPGAAPPGPQLIVEPLGDGLFSVRVVPAGATPLP
jgi:hypothetical protein